MSCPNTLCYSPPGDDGWNLHGYIVEAPFLHPAVRFRYRPAIPTERSVILGQMSGKSPAAQDLIIFRALAARIKSWDIKLKGGGDAPITADFIATLYFDILDRLSSIIVYGSQISDPDPEWTQKQVTDEADLELEAAIAGTTVSGERQRVAEGN